MDKIFVDKYGEMELYSPDPESRRHVRFPVCLSINRDNGETTGCLDFIFNASKGGIFVRTDFPSPVGTKITVHFYIPPDAKVLGIFEGEVVKTFHDPAYVKGMQVRLINSSREDMQQLEEYLEEKRHLFDKEI